MSGARDDRVISCSEAIDRLWHYLEDELTADRRGEVEQHLAFCRRCCGELEFAHELRRFLADAARPQLPADVEGRLVSFLNGLDDSAMTTGRTDDDSRTGEVESL